MAKKSGSNSSRSERRAGRQRAERAREHGLPPRKEPPTRVRASTPEPGSAPDSEGRSTDAPPARPAKSAGIPTLVKVVGVAVLLLIGAYLLSQKRDAALTETQPAPEPPAAASAAPTTEVRAEPEAQPAPSSTQAAPPAAAPEAPAPVVSVTPPTKPLVVAPVVPGLAVSAPARPRVEKPPAASKPAAIAAPAAPAAPLRSPAPVAAPPAAPPKPALRPAPPVDNPY